METPPPEKRLRVAPFAVHATRGLLRDQQARRKTMAITLVIAVVFTIAGLTVLRPWLDPQEHPWRFILYWLACAWEIVLVLLLALFDLLMVRAQTRAAKRLLQEQFRKGSAPEPPNQAGE
jgi:UPF0716 family protein affecting phage T7 exclusion